MNYTRRRGYLGSLVCQKPLTPEIMTTCKLPFDHFARYRRARFLGRRKRSLWHQCQRETARERT